DPISNRPFWASFISPVAHYPYHQILHIIEAPDGISTGIVFTNHFSVVIETMQLVVYSGAVGASIPI
ncbi:MAG TPA: hypothetical protein PKK20_11030, partial [Verrucomicrobiota bacterium]|nr:hypothetical protein [Verrucomicrobiota bacterium]HOA60579.1 hypothetical protein [Verrucomicrobiota bacterium]HOF48320.1 hypothetical protein [Verrucomicrobiota bacterium]HOG87682.1 hypothetical protein [Verrucomicrobiota bacterium]HOR71467.1 hypothetical protein [Verrucomicrobiota bacterium]